MADVETPAGEWSDARDGGTPWPEERLVLEIFRHLPPDHRTGQRRVAEGESVAAAAEAYRVKLEAQGLYRDLAAAPRRVVKRLPDGSWPQQHDPPRPVEWEEDPTCWEVRGFRRDLQGEMQARYTVRTRQQKRHGPLEVMILRDGEEIGRYERNYPSLFRTFYPFLLRGQELALYSRNYSCTRLMKLPECEDLGGEDPARGGFCPTGYFVPYDPAAGLHGEFGFVSGCLWGDDSSWKVEYLDLLQAQQGRLNRDARFGYVELPDRLTLAEAIHCDWEEGPCEPYIQIIRRQTFNVRTGEAEHD